MADKGETEKRTVEAEAKPPETPVELVLAAAEKLEARRGQRQKTWGLMAAELRGLAERIRQYE